MGSLLARPTNATDNAQHSNRGAAVSLPDAADSVSALVTCRALRTALVEKCLLVQHLEVPFAEYNDSLFKVVG